jgi:hypothetical protein
LSTFSAAQYAPWPSPRADLRYRYLSEPTLGKVEFCDHAQSRRNHLPGRKPEVIMSRAPATECLHAHARLRSSVEPRAEPRSRHLPQGVVVVMVRRERSRFVRSSSSTRTVGLCACMWCGTSWTFTGKPRKGPLRRIPGRFEMRVARPHLRFSTVENRVTSTLHR